MTEYGRLHFESEGEFMLPIAEQASNDEKAFTRGKELPDAVEELGHRRTFGMDG